MLDENFLVSYIRDEYNFSDKKIQEFITGFRELSPSDKSDFIFDFIGSKIYKEKPVDIETFMDSPVFLEPVYEGSIFPMWRQMLKEIYPAPFQKAYNEVILSCATRSGKSTISMISFLYEMYQLMCMINPAKTLIGKASGSITFCALSKDNAAAVGQLCSQIHKGLSLSPYFQEKVKGNLAFSTVDKKGVLITENILLRAGSSYAAVVGTDLMCGCLDEANIPTTKIADEVLVETRLDIYRAMLDRRKATYDKAPRMTGIMWLTSSPTDEFDVLGERIKQVHNEGLQNVMIKDNISRWEVRGESMSSTFDFFLGSDTKEPCIVAESDIILSSSDYDNVIQVPERYRSDFRSNPSFATRDIAGRRTSSEQSFFRNVSVFERVFSKENNIFTMDELKIDINNLLEVEDYLKDKDYFSHPDNPQCFRYIHLDIASKQDRFGMSSVYSDMVEYVSNTGEKRYMRKYYIDFCLGIIPAGNGTVDILRVLEFVYNLKGKGYPIKVVTTDSHQGELARQIISKHGIKTEDPYNNLKNLILTERLEGFRNPILVKELRSLRESEKRIEKRKGSTDDLSDSLAGACWRCFNDKYFKYNDKAVFDMLNTLNSLSID